MKIYRNENVLDAARRRMRWLFEEFREVSVTISGGKDSIVCYNLALEAARELDMLPLKVMFIDQEAEWECVIDQVQYMMYHPDVEPYWYQMPIRMSNATSTYEQWLRAWDPDQEDVWMREKDPISIKENNFDTDRFHDLFKAISYDVHPWGGADIVGLRGEEAPTRLLALTTGMDYHGVTWFSHQTRVNQKSEWEDRIYRYAFYPIYDWTYSDVWKAIHDHGWKYPSVYDSMYQHGVPIRNMRVSHLHHEEAVGTLKYLQEIEPQTWEKLTRRIQGIDAYSKIGFEKITLAVHVQGLERVPGLSTSSSDRGSRV